MAHIGPTSNPSPDDWPAVFKANIIRSLQAARSRVEVHAYNLPAEASERALNVLGYAFRLPEAWPHTRALLLAMLPKMEQVGPGGDWLNCLTQGVQHGKEWGDSEAFAEFSWQLGNLYRRESQFDQAREWLQASVVCFTQIDQTRGRARALNELAFVACLQHNYIEANQQVEAALQLLDESDPERALSYRTQGMIATDHYRWQEAENLHRKSLHLSEKQGDKRGIAWYLQNLGYALRGQERFAEAIDCFERAAAMLDSLQYTYHWAIVQMNIGLLYYYQDQPGEALRSHLQALDVFRKASDNLYLAKVHTNLGLAYWALHKWPQAEQAFLSSINLYASLGDESWRLNAVDGLAMTYLAQKLYAKAIAVLEPALVALPAIVKMPNYDYLHGSFTKHLREAREGLGAANKI
jgi:tetratricopeptide (TPR) repeat protein